MADKYNDRVFRLSELCARLTTTTKPWFTSELKNMYIGKYFVFVDTVRKMSPLIIQYSISEMLTVHHSMYLNGHGVRAYLGDKQRERLTCCGTTRLYHSIGLSSEPAGPSP